MTTIANGALRTSRPRIGRSEWILWNHALVRSAGFPLDWVDRFCDPRLARAADALPGHRPGFTPEDHEPFASQWMAHSKARSAAIVEIAAEPLFQLALTWQNRRFICSGLEPLLRQIADQRPRDQKRRSRELTVAAYWQRYCTKSESIGFFGPVAWATVSAEGPAVTTEHGPALVAQREVFLEGWPIIELAKSLARQVDLRPWMAPRRAPHVRARDGAVTAPDGQCQPVSALAMACLDHADGRTRVPDLIRAVGHECADATRTQIYQQLEALHQRGWLIWRFELSPAAHPEEELRSLLARCEAAQAADTLAALDAMTAAREMASSGWDSPARLAHALDGLDSAFTAATGQRGVRHEGLSYAGRTLAYIDSRRDVSVSIGARIIAEMEPVAFVLDSIRWVLSQVADGISAYIVAAYQRLRGRGQEIPNAAMLWVECLPLLEVTLRGIVEQAVSAAQSRWTSILRLADAAATATFTAGDIRARVRASFGTARPGWTGARWCSPDVMIAASSEAAISAGDFRLVLGEIHSAINTLDYSSMVSFHPRPADLTACLDQDHPGPRLLVALAREARPRLTARSQPALVRDDDYRLMLSPHVPVPTRGIPCAAADTDVVECGSQLFLVLPDGMRFDVIDMFAEPLKAAVAQSFDLLPASAHRPRVSIDRVVVARERWALPAADLSFASLPTEGLRFAGARRWARELRMPSRAFVKSPLEVKPFYVDFRAPAYLEYLAAAVRRLVRREPAAFIQLVEMLPDHDETWLTDAHGRRYVAEFRFVACDARGR